MNTKITRKEIKVLNAVRYTALSAAELAIALNKSVEEISKIIRKLETAELVIHGYGSVDVNLYYRYDITESGCALLRGKA